MLLGFSEVPTPGTTNTGQAASSHLVSAHHPSSSTSSLKGCISYSKQPRTYIKTSQLSTTSTTSLQQTFQAPTPASMNHNFQASAPLWALESKIPKASQAQQPTSMASILTVAVEARLRLPPQKLAKAKDQVTATIRRRSITLHELQSLTGCLAFCAKVGPISRSFLRRLYNAIGGQSWPIPITAEIQLDLHWWHDFLPKWNGISLIHKDRAVRHL